ncbi:tRNA pseudouridine synthase a mitochondrial [Phtheirospermum japonicum]|uniref:tRNA pseudouridine synthase a mitochondrial n=1 Tax=Phtheirospermum japonicum TaxID=374723 RepID=A0A830CVA6_9LAMI|nr:tRNA pseudouridine synthase a mitochondrial [Phtheirospermum japonicum]
MAESASFQPQEEQPESKRQKMSTTTTDDEEQNLENPESIPRKPKYRRRKVAIFFAYCGVGYQGMQKNPGAKTIEGDLEEALYLSGAVPEEERGKPRRYDWARSARTDKGVSAVGQVVSGRFYVDPPGFIERLNSNLVPQIRVFGYKRATPAFNSKKFCDRRRYVYLIPVFALDPTCHRDRESVLASLGSGNELVKCLECSERGRKVFGLMGKRSYESKIAGDNVEVGSGISSNSESALAQNDKMEDDKVVLVENNNPVNSLEKGDHDAVNENASSENGAENVEKMQEDKTEDGKVVSVENNNIVANSSETNGSEIVQKTKEDKLECENANDEAKSEKKSEFIYGEEEKERFNRILKYYEGTHNFHNFTTRTKAEDPAAKRYILSFNANTVISIDGFDFVKCEVVGQSFMLHQIRKMIGLAVAIMRNCAPESLIETALQQKVNINVPMAPEVGLYLDECFFPSYNQKWKDTHEELSMKDYADEAEEFKMKYIYSHIAATENKEGSMAIWLHSLNYRNYPDLRFADDGPSCDGQANEVVDNCQVSDAKHDEIKNMDE